MSTKLAPPSAPLLLGNGRPLVLFHIWSAAARRRFYAGRCADKLQFIFRPSAGTLSPPPNNIAPSFRAEFAKRGIPLLFHWFSLVLLRHSPHLRAPHPSRFSAKGGLLPSTVSLPLLSLLGFLLPLRSLRLCVI